MKPFVYIVFRSCFRTQGLCPINLTSKLAFPESVKCFLLERHSSLKREVFLRQETETDKTERELLAGSLMSHPANEENGGGLANPDKMPLVFFDIGDTLATPILAPDDRLIGFNVFPETRTSLEALKARNIRLGIISNAGDELPANVNALLDECGLLQFFDPDIIVYGKKDSPAIFVTAAEKGGVTPEQCVFVGENSRERSFALAADFSAVSPHPLLTLDVIDGIALVYARVRLNDEAQIGKWSELRTSLAIVPLQVTGAMPRTIVAIASMKAIAALKSAQLEVEVLGDEGGPQNTDLYLVHDDREPPAGFASASDNSASFLADRGESNLPVAYTAEGVYLAIPADRSIEEIHFPEARHGHNEKLIPDITLLDVLEKPAAEADAAASFLAPPEIALSPDDIEAVKAITASAVERFHQPYCGLAPLEGAVVTSRHIWHPDNKRVVEALQRQLKTLGGPDIVVSRHRFQHENLFLHNVVAEFPGTEPETMVLVTAHLDSTAASSDGPYHPASDPAPGSDDDASGVAAVLAIVEMVAKLRAIRPTKRTIRFVLFNAEEHGLVGSKAYARSQAAQGAQIVALFQMDMIGFCGSHNLPPHNYEVHAGFPANREVETRSLALANIVKSIAASVSPNLSAPQIYPDPETGNQDPAAGRSDHGPFNERGYAACVLSEDFFSGPKLESPDAQPNPNYHKRSDKSIDYEYATHISRVVAAAALFAANI